MTNQCETLSFICRFCENRPFPGGWLLLGSLRGCRTVGWAVCSDIPDGRVFCIRQLIGGDDLFLMPVEVLDTVAENERRIADEVDDKSEEENGADDLKCLDWLVNYRLPEYFAALDDSFHQFTEKSLFRNSSDESISENIMYCEDKDYVAEEQMSCDTSTEKCLAKKCSLLCWIYRVLATSPERQLSLNDIYHRFLVLNSDWGKLSPNWKFSVGETLLNSKCFMYKHSLWSINADFALKHERDALAQGLSHRCPPSTCAVVDTSDLPVIC